MHPLMPLSQSATIGFDSTDEEVVICLERIVSGAPLPPNVIGEVNPFNVLPWNLPDDMWYFFNSEGHKATDSGYWKASKEDHRIFTNSTTTGSRTTLEYYTGKAPGGRKTDWVMHEYRINQKEHCEVNKFLDSSSLSRVFLNYGQSSNGGEQFSNAGAQNANGKMTNSQDSTSRSKVFSREEGPLAITEEHGGHARPDHHVHSRNEFYDFSMGDFLELLDLDIAESPSSSSENSSCLTLSSDEYFDPLALLQDIEAAEHNQEMQLKHTDNKFQASAPLRLNRVVQKAESLGFCPGNSLRSLRSGENLMLDSSLRGLAVDQQFPNCKNSKNALCLVGAGGVNQEQRVTNQGTVASSSQGVRTVSAFRKSESVAARIEKLWKKYLCFVRF